MRPLILFIACLWLATELPAQDLTGPPFTGMMQLTDTTTARVSSYDRSGANTDYRPLAAGETLELARLEGAGVVRHLYFSILGGEHYLRDLVLRAYWDGVDTPCIEVPFGDFFGLGQERPRFFSSLMVTVNPGDLGIFGTYGFNSYFPMPYAAGARFTLTNEGPEAVAAVWYHIEFERMRALPSGLGRFHASWRRENPTQAVGPTQNTTLHGALNDSGLGNYVVLDAEGHGSLAGIFLNIDNATARWYGEGDDMIFIDGEAWPPSYHGTGSEEIFGGGACPTAEYAGPYTGFHLIGNLDYSGKVSMYRFYVNDPVRFRKSIRMTIEHGHANNFGNDYSSTAFWYQTEPHKAFTALPAPTARRARVGIDPHDRAYASLSALRPKLLSVWLTSIRADRPIPPALQQSIKHDLSQSYLQRDYSAVEERARALESQLDAFLEAKSPE